jgi:SAM-dependent methyltransferase
LHALRLLDADGLPEHAVALGHRALLDTQSAFDAVAPEYGGANDANPILQAMRSRTMACLAAYVRPGAHVLDLGCGPGADDEALARAGYAVTAIDWSPAMVAEARARIERAGLAHRVDVQHVGIHELDRLPAGTFDAACSNFGPLNCVPDLDRVARALAQRLRPGAPLVASVIGRVCPWEIALFAARRNWPRVRVRFADGFVAVPLEGRTVWTHYYSPRGFARPFEAAGFRRAYLRGLGLLAPPPYLEAFARRHPAAVSRLLAIEDEVGRWPGLRQLGDHFLIVLTRV